MSAFFYGTLMHPKILQRVIGNDGSHLTICPAVLLDYTRHHVKDADYPGIVPWSEGQALFNRELSQEEKSVRGTFVHGLTERDIMLLDIFEGNEYSRRLVQVHPLSPLAPLSEGSDDLVPASLPALPSEVPPAVEAESYIFRDIKWLSKDIWSYDDFVEKNAWKWYGKEAVNRQDIVEVDMVRARLDAAGNT